MGGRHGRAAGGRACQPGSRGGLTIEADLAHLAFVPKIAGTMLSIQQAEAILSARHLIVRGSLGMVESALADLSDRRVVDLHEDSKAATVLNLLVVVYANRTVQPVVNTERPYG